VYPTHLSFNPRLLSINSLSCRTDRAGRPGSERAPVGRAGSARAAKGTTSRSSASVGASDTNSSMAPSPLSPRGERACEDALRVLCGAGDLGGIRQDRAWVKKSPGRHAGEAHPQRELAVSGGHGTGSTVSGGSIYPTHAVAHAAHARGRRTVGGGRELRERQPHAEPLPTRPARSCSGNAMRQRINGTARMPMHTPAESLHRCPPTAR
jgi:hypothetical protein